MKRMLFALFLVPTICFAQDDEPSFLDNYYMEEVEDGLTGVYHYCKARMIEFDGEMYRTKNTQYYILYLGKRDAYADIVKFIEKQ